MTDADAYDPRADISPEEIEEWSVHYRTLAALWQSDGSLYHYTDSGGFKGILDSGQLWGTHVAYLNDSQEFSYGVESICKMIAEYAEWVKNPEAKRGEQAEFLSTIIMAVRDRVLRAREVLEDQFGPFVTCFSMFGDDLSQWRGYANGGYAICFDGEALKDQVEQAQGASDDMPLPESAPKPELHQVEYIPKKQSERLAEIVDDHITELIEAASTDPINKVPLAQERLIEKMIPLAAAIKHFAFVGEAEQRLIAHTSETFYTPSPIGLIPRVRFKFEPSAVKKVIVGPSSLGETKKLSLERYLRHKYPHVEVAQSRVPYREVV